MEAGANIKIMMLFCLPQPEARHMEEAGGAEGRGAVGGGCEPPDTPSSGLQVPDVDQ